MKRADPVATTAGARGSSGRQRMGNLIVGRAAPFGFDLREWLALGIVAYMGILLVQFGLGMGINLFVTIPRDHSGTGAGNIVVGFAESIVWGIAHGPLLLAIHVILGVVVLVHPLFVAVGVPPLVRGSRWPTVAGVVCVWGAAASGAAYLTYQQDVYSLLMALGFGGAMLCYTITLALVIHVASTGAGLAPETPAP